MQDETMIKINKTEKFAKLALSKRSQKITDNFDLLVQRTDTIFGNIVSEELQFSNT